MDACIARALVDYQVPAAAVAAVQNGEVGQLKGYGMRAAIKPDAVDENTFLQLASLSKPFTGAAAATLVNEDELAWDTPITTYLSEAALQASAADATAVILWHSVAANTRKQHYAISMVKWPSLDRIVVPYLQRI